jgi:hypothetical protein
VHEAGEETFAFSSDHISWARGLELIQEIRVADLDAAEQRIAFDICMSSFPVFSTFLDGNVSDLPPLLRYALISKALFGSGSTECPDDIADDVDAMVEEGATTDWYQLSSTGGRVHNVRLGILGDASIDPAVLEDELENSGELGTVRVIAGNPSCPTRLLEQILKGQTLAFDLLDKDDQFAVAEMNEIKVLARDRLGARSTTD